MQNLPRVCFSEAKTNSGESTSAEEEQKDPAAAPEGEQSGDAGEKATEKAPEDGKPGEDGENAEGEKSEKSGAEEQGKKKKKKDAAKKIEWVTKSEQKRKYLRCVLRGFLINC